MVTRFDQTLSLPICWHHCYFAAKRSLIKEEIPPSGGSFMKTSIHFKRHGNGYFHLHPLHAVFSFIASFVLAALIVLMLVHSAR